MQKIVLIGAGNVAWHLAYQLKNCGKEIVQIFNHNILKANYLANEIKCEAICSLSQLKEADLYIIAVTDSVISSILETGCFNNKNVVHTAACVDISVFKGRAKNFGVLYPLQTFTIESSINFNKVTFFLEACNDSFLTDLRLFVKEISSNSQIADSEQRKSIHLAAVFACNFTNLFYQISDKILEKSKLEFSILHQLITETAQKVQYTKPLQAQTGPARRNDKQTLDLHREMLEKQPDLLALYNQLTDRIQKNYGVY